MGSKIFFSTFGIIFLAELGDKTQLAAMALAARYHWKGIFLGLAAAFALLNLAAVLAGKILFTLLPLFWIKLASGGLFLFFGLAAILTKVDDEEREKGEDRKLSARGPAITAFLMILAAELGDKTQLVTASLAAQHNALLTVFAGSTLALWSVSLIGLFLGRQIARFLPLSAVQKGAGCLFLVFGVAVLYQAFSGG